MPKTIMNRFFVPAFLFILLISTFVPERILNADGPITVEDAISNNTGNATVEGYIVAHTTGNKSYDFEAPFSNDFNIALADSPTETDIDKLLPVQLPASFRAQFGLQSNPSLIGSKIQVTGNLETYYTVPGLKSPSSIIFAEEPDTTPKAAIAVSSISPGPISSGTAISLSTETENGTIYYTTNGTEPTKDSTEYTTPSVITENTTIKAIVIADGYKDSDIATFTYSIATSGLQIHDIQGAGHYSPYRDQYVADVQGIVTYIVDANNFYMQSLTPDKNPATSEGILVYKRNHATQVGDTIKASGQVKEWVLEGYSEKLTTDLPVTEINATNITIEDQSNPLPQPIEISPLKGQPTRIIDNDQFSQFDPGRMGLTIMRALKECS